MGGDSWGRLEKASGLRQESRVHIPSFAPSWQWGNQTTLSTELKVPALQNEYKPLPQRVVSRQHESPNVAAFCTR